ncbi:uncharacterized protein LOC135824818 [Sycon ciliatum]|uniref:uncharacterized protein LOC135824818 n=1 Tax=Sycon ciliatum TaxID=27933 RepID=UPI0031F6B20D
MTSNCIPMMVCQSALLLWMVQLAAGASSFLSAYRGFSLFLDDADVRNALHGGQISNELSIFENGFENRWLTSILSTPHVKLPPSKSSLAFTWENSGKYSLHYQISARYRNAVQSSLENASPQRHISIPSSGLLLPESRQSFHAEFDCIPDTVGISILEVRFDVGQMLTTSLFFLRNCTEEYARRHTVTPNISSNSYDDSSLDSVSQDTPSRRNSSDPACLLARRYCGFTAPSDCPQERVCKRVCRMPRKRNGERLGRICNSSAVVTAQLVVRRSRREGRCGTVMHFATRYAQSYSKSRNSSYIGFSSFSADTFRVVVPEEIARCRCFGELTAGTQYIITGRWNTMKSRLHLDADSLVVRLRRKLRAYLIRTEC